MSVDEDKYQEDVCKQFSGSNKAAEPQITITRTPKGTPFKLSYVLQDSSTSLKVLTITLSLQANVLYVGC